MYLDDLQWLTWCLPVGCHLVIRYCWNKNLKIVKELKKKKKKKTDRPIQLFFIFEKLIKMLPRGRTPGC
jgi:hypothetical protein